MYKDFTTLTKPVFSIDEKKGILPPLVVMRIGGGRKFNNDEFYEYHKQRGYSTQKCYQLRNAIEDAIRRGWLKEFIYRNASCKEGKPLRKGKHDYNDDKDDEDDEKTVRNAGKAQV